MLGLDRLIRAVGTGDPKFGSYYLECDVMAVIVPIHTHLGGETHGTILVGQLLNFLRFDH